MYLPGDWFNPLSNCRCSVALLSLCLAYSAGTEVDEVDSFQLECANLCETSSLILARIGCFSHDMCIIPVIIHLLTVLVVSAAVFYNMLSELEELDESKAWPRLFQVRIVFH